MVPKADEQEFSSISGEIMAWAKMSLVSAACIQCILHNMNGYNTHPLGRCAEHESI